MTYDISEKFVENKCFSLNCTIYRISNLSRPLVKSDYHGSESASFLGPKIQDTLPDDCKDIRLRNGNLKTVLESSVRLTLAIQIFLQKGKKGLEYSSSNFGIVAVACRYRFATNASQSSPKLQQYLNLIFFVDFVVFIITVFFR